MKTRCQFLNLLQFSSYCWLIEAAFCLLVCKLIGQYQVCSSSSSLDKPSISSSSPPIARQNCIAIYNVVLKQDKIFYISFYSYCSMNSNARITKRVHFLHKILHHEEFLKITIHHKSILNITHTFSAYCFLCSAGMDSARSAKSNWTVHLPVDYILMWL